jgi:UDP-glucose 4-epimerase
MKIVVTGAAGFVASHLIPALAEAGHDVYAVDRDASRISALPARPVEWDLSQPRPDLPDVDAAIHLAQANVPFPEEARALYAVNVGSVLELLDHCRRCGAERFLYASSGSVYGFGSAPFTETDPPAGSDLYAVSKLSGELVVQAFAPFFSTFIARLFVPYGPGQRARMIPRLVERVQAGEPVTVNNGRHPRMNPLYIEDVVRVFLAALELDGHHLVNVGGDEAAGIDDLARLIGEAVGRKPVFEQADGGAPGDIVGDTTRLHELLDLRPLVPLRDGLRAVASS